MDLGKLSFETGGYTTLSFSESEQFLPINLRCNVVLHAKIDLIFESIRKSNK